MTGRGWGGGAEVDGVMGWAALIGIEMTHSFPCGIRPQVGRDRIALLGHRAYDVLERGKGNCWLLAPHRIDLSSKTEIC